MTILSFIYKNGRGKMTLDLDKFFPCSQKSFKNLLGAIGLADYIEREQANKELKVYFQKQLDGFSDLKKGTAKKYSDFKQKDSDIGKMMSSGKFPNGLPITKDEFSELKAEQKEYRKEWKQALSLHKKYVRLEKQFTKYLEILRW